jgi:hypothetical protein
MIFSNRQNFVQIGQNFFPVPCATTQSVDNICHIGQNICDFCNTSGSELTDKKKGGRAKGTDRPKVEDQIHCDT